MKNHKLKIEKPCHEDWNKMDYMCYPFNLTSALLGSKYLKGKIPVAFNQKSGLGTKKHFRLDHFL